MIGFPKYSRWHLGNFFSSEKYNTKYLAEVSKNTWSGWPDPRNISHTVLVSYPKVSRLNENIASWSMSKIKVLTTIDYRLQRQKPRQ